MAPRKAERILNLTICLLAAPRFLTREQIREAVEGYAGMSDIAFQRTFERDKDELRELGVPIETGSNEIFFDDDLGYRISRTDFELPAIEFSAAEAAVVSVAGRVWQEANLAESTQVALAKLRAAGLPTDTDRLGVLGPGETFRDDAFEPLFQAVVSATRVRFSYLRAGATEASRRTVQPWGVVSHKGSWYLIGHDTDRDDTRRFKLARMVDVPRTVGRAGAYVVPPDLDLRALASHLDGGASPRGTALVAIRRGRVAWLRRRGVPSPEASGLPEGFDAFAVEYAGSDSFLGDIVSCGSDVLVLEPVELREQLRRHLAAFVAALGGTAD